MIELCYLFIIVVSVDSLNFHHNELISIDFHINEPIPDTVTKYSAIACDDVYEAYSPKNIGYKIGNVVENGKIIYADSDILQYRRVLMNKRANGREVLMIYSTYSKSENEYREVIELKKDPNDQDYREIVRFPFKIDIKTFIKNHGSAIQLSDTGNRLYLRIKKELRDYCILGTIKYGGVVIDDAFRNVIYKEAIKYTENGNEMILIWKKTRDGYNIRNKYQIKDDNGVVTINKLEENKQSLF